MEFSWACDSALVGVRKAKGGGGIQIEERGGGIEHGKEMESMDRLMDWFYNP
jgi:hypothetical protein